MGCLLPRQVLIAGWHSGLVHTNSIFTTPVCLHISLFFNVSFVRSVEASRPLQPMLSKVHGLGLGSLTAFNVGRSAATGLPGLGHGPCWSRALTCSRARAGERPGLSRRGPPRARSFHLLSGAVHQHIGHQQAACPFI